MPTKKFKKDDPSLKDNKKQREFTKKTPRLSACNDWQWYAQSEQLLKDTASYPFSQMLGIPLPTGSLPADVGLTGFKPDVIPGIMVFDLEPTLGCEEQETSAATVSARNLYSYVRHANSGHANYEAPDLLMYIVGYIGVASLLEDAKRAYSFMRTYALKNRYYARALVRAAGYDYDDLLTKLSDFRSFINISVARLNALKIPSTNSYLLRQLWISANYYLDESTSKAQIYFTRFKRFPKLEPTRWETGTGISFRERPTLFTLDTFKALVEELISQIISNEDFNIMSGDIIKAFGDNVYSGTMIAEDYLIVPAYSEEVLMQLHNASVIHTVGGDNASFIHTVQQTDTGFIKEEFAIKSTAVYKPTSQMIASMNVDFRWLDIHKDAPEPKDVIVATRLMNIVKSDYSGQYFSDADTIPAQKRFLTLESTGTEVVTGITIVSAPDSLGYKLINLWAVNEFTPEQLAGVSKFDQSPLVYLINEEGDDPESRYYILAGVFGEIDNVVSLSSDDLSKMHRMAVLNELDFTNHLSVKDGGFIK